MSRLPWLAASMVVLSLVLVSSFSSAQAINNYTDLQTAVAGTNTTIQLEAGSNIVFTGAISYTSSSRPVFDLIGAVDGGNLPTVVLNGDGYRLLDVAGNIGRIDGIWVINADGNSAANANGSGLGRYDGGAFYIKGAITEGIHNSIFESSTNIPAVTTTNTHRGIIYAQSLSGGISNSSFLNNTVKSNGAIYILGDFSGGLTDSTFINNVTTHNSDAKSAGALNVSGSFSGDISGSYFEANSGPSNGGTGGAVGIGSSLNGSVIQSTFINNNSGNGGLGGGLGVVGDITGGISVSKFEGNTASMGGGVYADSIGQGISDSTFTSNVATLGGAVVAYRGLAGGINNSIFTGNQATGSSGQGGAIFSMGAGISGGISNSTFSNNYALSYGGAILASAFSGDITDSIFSGNETAATTSSYGGGAMFVAGAFTGNILRSQFSDNRTYNAGGALYATSLTGSISDNVFSGNSSVNLGGALYLGTLSGDIDSNVFSGNSSQGRGGALYVGAMLGNLINSDFSDNTVQGESGLTLRGLGGAIYAINDWNIIGGAFQGNQASTANAGDETSGRGGAIFHDNQKGASTLLLQALYADQPLYFSGNTHDPGGAGATANSIYFGTTLSTGQIRQTDVTVDAAAGANIYMADPISSQADNLDNELGGFFDRLVVNIQKTGAGIWTLGGDTLMAGGSHWLITEGELRLIGGDAAAGAPSSDPVSITLSHADSSFVLASGANLTASIASSAHTISAAAQVTLAQGSTSGISGPGGVPFIARNVTAGVPIDVLVIASNGTLSNDQDVEQGTGTMEVGLTNRNYRLYWGGSENTILYIEFGEALADGSPGNQSLTSTLSRGAVSSLTAPGVIVRSSLAGGRIIGRGGRYFLAGERLPESGSLWLSPAYGHGRRTSGSGRPGYSLDNYGAMIGYDWPLADFPAFLGLAAHYYRSDYDSFDTDLTGDTIEGFIYGGLYLPGALELSAFGGLGRTDYDQTRKVGLYQYKADYKSTHYRLGAEFGRRFYLSDHFSMRPFLAYEWLRVAADGFQEKVGVYAVSTDDFRQNIQEVKVGTSLTWTFDNQAFIDGRVYYSGITSGRRAETNLTFVGYEETDYRAGGDELPRHAFGLNLGGGLSLAYNMSLKMDYQLEAGSHTVNQQGRLTFNLSF